jgi:glycosyltransferase involved in cell wall biosynthesis
MLSIITINRNHEHGLDKTIASLAAQTDQGFQWVFVDGLSTDGSLELARSFVRPGDIVISEHDFGIYNAMNKGAQRATGDAILFLNSGDVFADGSASASIARDCLPGVDMLLYGFEVRNTIRMPKPLWWRIWNIPTSHQAIIYRPALLAPAYRFNESYRFLADYEHFLRLPLASLNIVRIDHLLVKNENYGTDGHLKLVCEEVKKIGRAHV